MVTVDAPDTSGEVQERVVLESAAADPFAAALAGSLEPPYRLRAVRGRAGRWAVAARRIRIAELPGVSGDELVLTVQAGGATLEVDGMPTAGGIEEIVAAVPSEHASYVLTARRHEGDRWEVDVLPL